MPALAEAPAPLLVDPGIEAAAGQAAPFALEPVAEQGGALGVQPDAAAATALPAAETPRKPYTYRTEDGQVRTAESVEEAMTVCSVLGSMSVGRAERLLRLHAMGQEKLAAQAEQPSTPPEKPVGDPPKSKLQQLLRPRKPDAPRDRSALNATETAVTETATPLATTPETEQAAPAAVIAEMPQRVIEEQMPALPFAAALETPVPPQQLTPPQYAPLQHAAAEAAAQREVPALEVTEAAPEIRITDPESPQAAEATETKAAVRELPVVEQAAPPPAPAAEMLIEPAAATQERVQFAPIEMTSEITAAAEPAAENPAIEADFSLWEAELAAPAAPEYSEEKSAEPLPITYEAFQNALLESVEPAAIHVALPLENGAEAAIPVETTIAPPSASQEVAERLTVLEPAKKEVATPIIQSISEVVMEVRALTMSHATQEELSAAETQLAELCAELFEAIGIQYDDEKIRQFVQSLVHPAFAQRLAPADMLDLERRGTHEVKRSAPLLATTLTNLLAPSPVHGLLGSITLLRAHPTLQDDVFAFVAAYNSPN